MKNESLFYRAHGLRVASDLPLPDLPVDEKACAETDAGADLTIRLRPLPALPETALEADGIRFRASGDILSFDVPDLARFEVAGGEAIAVDPAPGSSADAIVAVLTGTAMAAAALRRGLLPLHASCVALAGGAVAFMGPSGSGKSTMAAHLAARGWSILADDLCLVHACDRRGAHVAPGMRRVKLWGDAAERLGLDVTALTPLSSGLSKYHVPLNDVTAAADVPLRALCLLEERAASETGLRRLTGAQAVHSLIEQTYRPELLKLLGLADAYLLRCTRILRDIPFFAVARSADPSELAADCAALDGQLRALIRP